MRRAWDYIFDPVRFFEELLGLPCDWWLAAAGPIICGFLAGITSTVLGDVWREVQVDVLRYLGVSLAALPPSGLVTVLVTLSYPAWFGISVLALLAINVLCEDHAEAGRLAEFAGLCFWTQIPGCLGVIVLALSFEPEPFRPPSGAERVAAVLAFVEAQNSAPLLLAMRLVFYGSAFWLVTQLTVALKVAGRLSTRAALVSAAFLTLLFCGIPIVSDWT